MIKNEIDKDLFFREATLRICGSLNLHRAMAHTLEYIREYIPADCLHISLFEPSLRMVRNIVQIRPDHWQALPELMPLPEQAIPHVTQERETRRSFRMINSFQETEPPEIRDLIKQSFPEEISLLRTDLVLETERIGILMLGARGNHRYHENDAELMSRLNEPFAIAVANALQHQETIRLKEMLEDDNQYLYNELHNFSRDQIIGENLGLKEIMQMIRQVAPLESPVLLLGETGTGKELLANALHTASPRRNGPFVKVNCGGLPESLMDSELFGHEKGAFTGATTLKRGRFERANGGTLFLDEIGELSLNAQVKLLRVLQHREIERVGGIKTIPVDVRIISATHRNLEQMIREGKFREDLWFRLNVFPVMIPPLRQRFEDMPALLDYLITQKCREMKITRKAQIPPGTMERLREYHWPGNVRELQNLVERSLIQNLFNHPGTDVITLTLDLAIIPPTYAESRKQPAPETEFLSFDDAASRHIIKSLEITGGKIIGPGGAAELLRMNPSTLRGKMRRLGISRHATTSNNGLP